MKIEFISNGNIAKVVIHSFITEHRKLNRLVDAALLRTPVQQSTTGLLFRVTTLYGKQSHVRRAYKIICREMSR
ncbi:hypothetical protein [Morganella morganii]|uniref:hypothetical protein n=1 Tax=Morganella morganii TaxID=582 RepID=UPI001F26BBAE|nr:hypothetical protein [Morganella morganii]MCF1266565.1 hypothetical protein [Morganella morganii]MDW7795913.1 hypothetical protein [Morganella morganii]